MNDSNQHDKGHKSQPTIDAAMVNRVAKLARLQLNDSERTSLVGDLRRIVAYVDQLQETNTDGIEPLIHTTATATPMRDDVSEPTMGATKALANAPAQAADCFVVPRVVGG